MIPKNDGSFDANLANSNQNIDAQASSMIDGGQFARAPPIDNGRVIPSQQISINQICRDVLASGETLPSSVGPFDGSHPGPGYGVNNGNQNINANNYMGFAFLSDSATAVVDSTQYYASGIDPFAALFDNGLFMVEESDELIWDQLALTPSTSGLAIQAKVPASAAIDSNMAKTVRYKCGGFCGKFKCDAEFDSQEDLDREHFPTFTRCGHCNSLQKTRNFKRHMRTCN